MLVYVYCKCKVDFVSMLASHLQCCMVRHLFTAHAVRPQDMLVPSGRGDGTWQTVRMLPVLTTLHCDWLMRAHATMWKAPTGTYSGD